MQATASGGIVDRMIGAARLDPATFESVEADDSATSQAMIVVILAAIAGAIGALGDASIGRIIGGALTAILGWAVFSFIAHWVGTNMLASPATSATQGQVLRTLGFAYTPSILQVFAFIPVLGWILAVIGGLWFLVAAIVALRHALEVSTGRAIAIALVSLIPYLIVAAIIGLIFGSANMS